MSYIAKLAMFKRKKTKEFFELEPLVETTTDEGIFRSVGGALNRAVYIGHLRKALFSSDTLSLFLRRLDISPVRLNTLSANACEAGIERRSKATFLRYGNTSELCETQKSN
ncbi:unnamed protein product [Lepeophtheirus salmonis]|uniref:(salmon louse) hypothetical protein n=1 Tax=Lepeophtheirus salmonis TaxID=72036 RepID=A0A7R8CQT7_LEPSM|nr:unnamed protein product [Lepeophtheirus salmonis]CAF2898608.1 unnamed protein product [Lepeophtheirus salmonis]